MRRKSRSGVALLMVLMCMALLAVLAVEIIFASRVELRIGRNARDRLQAVYLAQSAARFSLLRLHFYILVQNLKDGGTMNPFPVTQSTIDQIWSAPLPKLPLAGQEVEWPGEFSSSLSSEGSKIPINLLDGNEHRSSSPELQKQVIAQIDNLIKGLQEDEEFDKIYRDLKREELVNSLRDWIDADELRVEGGDEVQDYEKIEPPYFPRNDRIPTLSELSMIKGWTDDLVRRIASNFSVINNRMELNPNYVSMDRLKALHPRFSPEDLKAIEQRRMEQPFKDLKDMQAFILDTQFVRNGDGFSFGDLKEEMRERVFYIESSGVVGDARRTLKLGVVIPTENPPPKPASQSGGGSGASAAPGGANSKPLKLLKPNIVTVEEML